MAFYRGEQGNVLFTHDANGTLTALTAVRSWSLSIEKESLDVTAHGDSFRNVVGSLISGSGTIEVLYEATAAGEGKGDLIREILTTTATESTNAKAELYTFDADGSQGSTSEKITFDLLVTSTEYGASVGELQVVSIGFQTKGTIAKSTVS
tara:strand:+ start:2185 stop:2637 length:453 start_codon:yes stop_codon:yes gene_type:complete